MKRSSLRLIPTIAVIFVMLGFGFAQSANACGAFLCWLIFSDGSSLHGICHTLSSVAAEHPGSTLMHMGETTVTSLGGRKALITVTGYAATNMDTSCADALAVVPGIRSVNSATVLNTETGEPLTETHYVPNSLSGAGFTAQAVEEGLGSSTYYGFFSKVRRPVPDDTHLTYVFEVTLKAGVRFADFAKAMSAHGVLGTARANEDGTLNIDHIHLRPLGTTPVSLVVLPPQQTPPVQ